MLNQIYAALRVVLQKDKAIEAFPGTRQSAIASFRILIIDIPLFLTLSYLAYRHLVAEQNVSLVLFFLHRMGIYAVAMLLSLWVMYYLARWQKVEAYYFRWVEGGNYLSLLKALFQVPLILWALSYPIENETRQAIGVSLFIMSLYVNWAMTTRSLGVNLFIGAGLTVVPMIIGTLLSDYSNYELFGAARPLLPVETSAAVELLNKQP